MKQLILALVALAALIPVPANAAYWSDLRKVTGVDQAGNPTVLMCVTSGTALYCHSVYGYTYGYPTAVTGDLWRAKAAARGYVYALVGPISVTCQPDTSYVGRELRCES